MHTVKAKTGPAFEIEIFGRANGEVSSDLWSEGKDNYIKFSVALREVIAQYNGFICPRTDVAEDLYYFVRKCLKESLGVSVDRLNLYPALKTRADIQKGVDAFFYLVSEGKECVALIDAFLVRGSYLTSIEASDPDTVSYDRYQDDLYKAKKVFSKMRTHFGSAIDFAEARREFREARVNGYVRHRNRFILTQYDVERPKGLRKLGREIALSLWMQLHPGEKAPF